MGMKWINKDKDTPKNTVTGLFQNENFDSVPQGMLRTLF